MIIIQNPDVSMCVYWTGKESEARPKNQSGRGSQVTFIHTHTVYFSYVHFTVSHVPKCCSYRGDVAHDNRPDVLGSEVTTYPPSSAAHLDTGPYTSSFFILTTTAASSPVVINDITSIIYFVFKISLLTSISSRESRTLQSTHIRL